MCLFVGFTHTNDCWVGGAAPVNLLSVVEIFPSQVLLLRSDALLVPVRVNTIICKLPSVSSHDFRVLLTYFASVFLHLPRLLVSPRPKLATIAS